MTPLQDIADAVTGLAASAVSRSEPGSARDASRLPAAALKTILVVDDELGPREALRHILTPVYNVVMAKDGREATELFAVAKPDMVISDIRMPVMSGIELMKALRRRSPDTPFVLLTGYATLESAQEAVRQGAFDYISKPYHVHDIRQTIARALEQAEQKSEGRKYLTRLQAMNTLLEEQIRALDQKASLGELSTEMIHDLNNPMSVLGGYISLLEDSLSRESKYGPSESREFIDVIKEQIERCVGLTRRFLDYARNSRQAWDREDVNEIIQDTFFVLRGRLRALHIRLEMALAQALPETWVQPTPLQQVFYNLAANAIDALAGIGTERCLTVTSRLLAPETGAPASGPAIEVVFRDSGPGVPAEIREQIFTPFFSTKPKGRGTGLGLSICKRILEEHGGAIRLESEFGHGAGFIVTIPLRSTKPSLPATA